MPRVQLCENDLYTIANALRVAAEQYERDAESIRDPAMARTVQQFKAQAVEVRAIADRLEDVGDGEDEDESAAEAYGRRAADYREDFHSDG